MKTQTKITQENITPVNALEGCSHTLILCGSIWYRNSHCFELAQKKNSNLMSMPKKAIILNSYFSFCFILFS